MDVKYYITKYDDGGIGLFVTSRADYWQERCRLRISPPLGEEIAHLKDVKGQTVVLGFDQIDSKVFNGVVEEVSMLNTIKELAIHNSKIHMDFTATFSNRACSFLKEAEVNVNSNLFCSLVWWAKTTTTAQNDDQNAERQGRRNYASRGMLDCIPFFADSIHK